MTAKLTSHGLLYVSTPKVASTSIKHLIFRIENDFCFNNFVANEKRIHIHRFYPARPFEQLTDIDGPNLLRFTVVRDPKARLISGYRHIRFRKTVFDSEEFQKKAKDHAIDPMPNFFEFVENLETYQKINRFILHHTRKAVHFLGRNKDFYQKIYTMEELPRMVQDLSALTGKKIELSKMQSSQETPTPDIPNEIDALIRSLFQDDYDCYGEFFE